MITHKDHFHGSDLEKIEKIYGIKKEDIISFSANVNPLGISPLMRERLTSNLDCISTYPDREYTALRDSIGNYNSCDANDVIVGNGTTELISLFIEIMHPKKAIVLGPTYSEYEREVTLNGGTTLYYPLKAENDFELDINHFTSKLDATIDMIILCNPNNPTSSSIPKSDMRHILDVCKENDIYVLVDETYVEFVDNINSISSVSLCTYYNNIIVLRGTSKFFASPGLRLGYAITGNKDLKKEILKRQDPWSINSLADIAGQIMFSDEEYINATRQLVSAEKDRMYELFKADDRFRPFKPSANFMLIEILDDKLDSEILFEQAIIENLMIRDCSTFPFLSNKFIRFCFMNPEDNDRLAKCLMR